MIQAGNKKTDISLGSIVVSLFFITMALPREFSYYVIRDWLTRAYGNGLSISVSAIVIIIGTIVARRFRLQGKVLKQHDIIRYLAWGIIIGFLLLLKNGSGYTYLVAAFKYVQYMIILYMLNNISTKSLIAGLRNGAIVGLLLQTVVGILFISNGIVIPYLTGTNYTVVRNGHIRLTGTFSHPGSLSLYLAVILLFFLCELLFLNKRSSLLYVLISAFDLYLSGARAMLIVSAVISFLLLMRRYKKNLFLKAGLLATVIVAIIWFFQSDIYEDLFVKNNAIDMLIVRFGHAIVGFQIMTHSFINAILGVGLNYHVDFKVMNSSLFVGIIRTVAMSASDANYEVALNIPVHNSFLVSGAELGVIGMVLYALIYINRIKKCIVLFKKREELSSTQLHDLIFCFSAICTLALYCMQGWGMHQTHGWSLLLMICVLTDNVVNNLSQQVG